MKKYLKYVAPGLVILAGVVFIAVTLAQNLFAVGSDFEEMITDFRPALQDEVIADYQATIGGLAAVPGEFQESVLPALAMATGAPVETLVGQLAEGFPDVMAGLSALPQLGPEFGGLIDTLASQQDNFASADAIPTNKFVAQTVPWGFTIVGLIAIGLGVWMMLKRTRLAAIIAAVLGAAIVIGSFALSLPGKSADADDLNEALEPIYTAETIERANGGLAVLGAMGSQMQAEMLPGLGQMLGQDEAAVGQFLGQVAPNTAAALGSFDQSMAKFEALVSTFEANLDNYETLKPVKFTPIIWIFIIGGFLIIVGGGLGYVWSKDE